MSTMIMNGCDWIIKMLRDKKNLKLRNWKESYRRGNLSSETTKSKILFRFFSNIRSLIIFLRLTRPSPSSFSLRYKKGGGKAGLYRGEVGSREDRENRGLPTPPRRFFFFAKDQKGIATTTSDQLWRGRAWIRGNHRPPPRIFSPLLFCPFFVSFYSLFFFSFI